MELVQTILIVLITVMYAHKSTVWASTSLYCSFLGSFSVTQKKNSSFFVFFRTQFNVRRCFNDPRSIPFDYCVTEKDDTTGEVICRCNCRNHYCNSYNPGCQQENLFTLTNATNSYAFHAAFESSSKDFLDHMKKTYPAGKVVTTVATTTTTTTTTTLTSKTTTATTTTTTRENQPIIEPDEPDIPIITTTHASKSSAQINLTERLVLILIFVSCQQ